MEYLVNSSHEKILNKLPSFLDRYNLQKYELYIFGSCARNEDRFDSDLDILCVFEDKDFIRNNISLIREIRSESRYIFNEKLDLHFYSKDTLENDNSIFVQNIRRDKKKLYGCIDT